MSEWIIEELGNLAQVKGGKRLPKGEILTDIPNNHPYIRTRNISNNKIVIGDLLYVPDDIFPAISRYIVEEGDVIISIVGTIGLCSVIPSALNLANLTENCAKIVDIDNTRLDPQYLYYYLISEDGQYEIETRNVGSTQPKLPLYNIKALPIPLPSIPEQRSIADVLSALDDKIDLLHRQNETLEALAQTLFRNMIIESEDYICEKWKTFLIGDKLEVFLGGTPSTRVNEYWDGNIPWINSGEINQFRILSPTRYITQAGFDNSSTKLLPAKTTVIAITGATLGQVSRLEIDVCANQSVIGILSSDEFSNEYIYLWIQNFIKEIIAKQTGGAQQHINTTDVRETSIIKPDNQTRKELQSQIEPLFEKISKNSFQIQTLGKLRDTLLPKLMSGEVRVQ